VRKGEITRGGNALRKDVEKEECPITIKSTPVPSIGVYRDLGSPLPGGRGEA